MSEQLAEVYSLVVSIDQIEKAYTRDSIDAQDYNELVTRLLSHLAKLVREPRVEDEYGSITHFVDRYGIDAPAGVRRIQLGIPATAEAVDIGIGAGAGAGSGGGSAKAVAKAAGDFITFCDGVHLKMRGKDDLHPLLAELATSLNRVTRQHFDGRGKIVEWLIKLNQLKNGETLSEEESAECLHDVDSAYQNFLAAID